MPAIVVAALSARSIAEVAARDGFEVIALDMFGDRDTRRASRRWRPIAGEGGTLDAGRLLAELGAAAEEHDVIGWVAGNGLDGRHRLLAEGAARLPLLGTAPGDLERLRSPRPFFDALRRLGLPHPPVAIGTPGNGAGWLSKDLHGSGGWQVRRAEDRVPVDALDAESAGRYLQREAPGLPMSATFVAAEGRALVLGFNALTVRPLAGRPFVYHGAIGPTALPAEAARFVGEAASMLAVEFSLRGLASLDFLLDHGETALLEVNARPPATLPLHADGQGCGPMRLHVAAALTGRLPTPFARTSLVRGEEILFARRPLHTDEATIEALAARPYCRDLPFAAQSFRAGDPVCSVAAEADDAAVVRRLLDERLARVRRLVEPTSGEPS